MTPPRSSDADEAAFDALMHTVYVPLQRYLHRRCDAASVDDVFNDTLLTIWRRIADVPSEAALPWCYGVARRCLANHRRGTERRLRLVGAARHHAPAPPDGWTDDAVVALHDALGHLDALDREVIRLWAWERLEPREIAQVLDTTPNAVSIRLSRARAHLRNDIGTTNRHSRKDPGVAGHRHDQSNTEQDR